MRQGAICGPTLCCISTDRINKMDQTPEIIKGNEIRYPTYVDDIVGAGSKERIEGMVEKMKVLESTKKFVFNNKKDKTELMIIQNNKKERIEDLEITVGKGRIERTKEYKYLGDTYNDEGNNKSKIRKRMEKAKYMAYEVKRYGSMEKV